MSKTQLQQELLEKVKPGVKPSDLKKKPLLQPPIQDEGYSSSEEKPIIPKPPITPNQTIKDLQNQIQALQNQLQLYKDFKEADLKVKEKLKEENKLLREKLTKQENPTLNQAEEPKTFLCSDCNQQKPQDQLSRAFNNFSFCLDCSKRARKQAQQEKQPSPQPSSFTCHSCQQTYQTTPIKMKLDSTLQTYLVCSPCQPTLKEFNEASLITDDLWAKYPYSSASEILEKEFNIKKGEPW